MKPSLIFAVLVLAVFPSLASSQTTYPLVCRGGGDLHFNYTPYSNLSPQPQIWITFTRAPQGVGANRENLAVLQPGQCSWLDRAVAAAEPGTIALLNVEQFAIQWQRGQVAGIGSAFASINALQDPGQYQAFDVYNNGRGYFVAADSSMPKAAKMPAGSAQEQGVRKTIGPDGSVELRYPDGRVEILRPPAVAEAGKRAELPPDTREAATTGVPRATPPPLPSNPWNIEWLSNQNNILLEIIRGLVGDDNEAVNRYLAYEGAANEYDKIEKRTDVIRRLLLP